MVTTLYDPWWGCSSMNIPYFLNETDLSNNDAIIKNRDRAISYLDFLKKHNKHEATKGAGDAAGGKRRRRVAAAGAAPAPSF